LAASAPWPAPKELSLEDQEDHAKQVVSELYDGPVEYRVIATKGKGERLDRPELADVEKMLRSSELDLLVAEDTVESSVEQKRLGFAVSQSRSVGLRPGSKCYRLASRG
jgi:hypothetical protein